MRRNVLSKSSVFRSPLRPSGATASIPDTLQKTESEMEISMVSDVFGQSFTTSHSHCPPAVTTTTAEDPVLD